MSNHSATIVQRLWNYCNVLRDDGMSYGDYVEQLTYLLFLKMDDQAQGVVHLQYVVYEYPGTREADLARERLRSLGLTIR